MEIVRIKPLSVNQAFQGRRFKTPIHKAWRKDIYFLLPKIKIPEGILKVKLIFGLSNSLSDIDNPIKCFLDSLKDKYGVDDRYIYELNVKKEVVKKGKEFIKFEITKL